MTKSEFVDQVAARSGLSRKDAGAAVDAALETIQEHARARQRGHVLRLRQVQRRPSAAPARASTRPPARRSRSPPRRRRSSPPGSQLKKAVKG